MQMLKGVTMVCFVNVEWQRNMSNNEKLKECSKCPIPSNVKDKPVMLLIMIKHS